MKFLGVLLLSSFISFSNFNFENINSFCQKNKTPRILLAEKTHWYGGVKGVKGIHYFIKIKKPLKTNLIFTKLFAEGNLIPIKTSKKGSSYEIHGVFTQKTSPQEFSESTITSENTTPALSPENNTSVSWLEYTSGKSKILKKITISKFVEKENTEQYQ